MTYSHTGSKRGIRDHCCYGNITGMHVCLCERVCALVVCLMASSKSLALVHVWGSRREEKGLRRKKEEESLTGRGWGEVEGQLHKRLWFPGSGLRGQEVAPQYPALQVKIFHPQHTSVSLPHTHRSPSVPWRCVLIKGKLWLFRGEAGEGISLGGSVRLWVFMRAVGQ